MKSVLFLLFLLSSIQIFSQKFNNSIIFFLDPECKLCLSKALDINNTISKHSDSLNIFFIFHSKTNEKKIKSFLYFFKKNKKHIQYYFDKKNELAINFGANTTPSVFLIDNNLKIVYSGALDDKDISIAVSKKSKSISYIDDAIEKYLKLQKQEFNFIKPIGCIFR